MDFVGGPEFILTHDALVGYWEVGVSFVGIAVLGVWWWGAKSPYGAPG